ncbi:MAG: hypothetical protein ABL864_07915 [Terricaulis sp.]|jgi:hypothetical protein
MKTVKELRKKVATRAPKKAPTYSTSEARANFAEALETAQLENAVIGFDRYGRLVAALVPIDAVRILAGRGAEVEPAVRDKIGRLARLFLQNVPKRGVADDGAPKPAKAPAAARQRAKRRV